MSVGCPVCGGLDYADTVRRDALPAMQNYVHRTLEDALAAQRGELVLAVCRSCGFAWNRAFDPELPVYDEGYDNAVPSAVMHSYYAELAAYLGERYLSSGGLAVDVGCGDGSFLRLLADAAPGVRGLGVDPALDGDATGGPVVLRKDVFRPGQIDEQPALLLSRHVLEHIPRPVDFLREIAAAASPFAPAPCYFEVPDLAWILEHEAFWDFCYEHCNYFTAASLAEAMERARLTPTERRTRFGGQYLSQEGMTAGELSRATTGADGAALAEKLQAYAATEVARVEEMRALLRSRRESGSEIVVWGMATKGVVFSLLVDPAASLIDHCVDINRNKQGCFVPVTGHVIAAPETLEHAPRKVTVVVMNANYLDEISAACHGLGLDADFVTMGV